MCFHTEGKRLSPISLQRSPKAIEVYWLPSSFIDHDCQVDAAVPCLDVGDVGHGMKRWHRASWPAFGRMALWPHIALPHCVVVIVGAGVFLAALLGNLKM